MWLQLRLKAAAGSRRLLAHTTGSYTVRSVTISAVTIDKDEVSIRVNLDLVPRMLRLPSNAEPAARLQNSAGQF